MPFRGIAKLMGAAVNLEMVDAVLYLVNGHFWRGLGRLLGAWRRKSRVEKEFCRKLTGAGREG